MEQTEKTIPKPTNSNKKLGINFVFNFINQIFVLIIPLITTPYVSRVLHEEGIGQLSYALSYITYFTLFANLGFNVYGQREVAKYRDDKEKLSIVFTEILLVRTITTAISLAVLASILFTVGFGEKYNILVLVYSINVVAVIFDLSFFYQGIENYKTIALMSIITKFIGIICIFAFVKASDDLWKYALINSIAPLISSLIMWPTAIKQLTKFNFLNVRPFKHVLPSLLIFLPTLAISIYSTFDKTMIGLLATNPDYENGCYEQAYKLNSIMLLLVTVISPVLISRNNYDYSHNNMEEFKNHLRFSARYVWLIGTPLIVGCCLLANNLTSWFLGDGYTEVPTLLCVMSVRFICSGFSVLFSDQFLIVIRKEKYTFFSAILASVINLTCNFIMIPTYGAVGAAIATAICEFAMTVALGFFMWRQHFINMKDFFLPCWKYIVGALIMGLPVYFVNRALNYTVWSFLLCVVLGVCVYGLILMILRDSLIIDFLKIGINKAKRFLKKGKKETNSHKD